MWSLTLPLCLFLYSKVRNVQALNPLSFPISLPSSSRPLTFPAPFCPFDSVRADGVSHCGSPSPVTCSSAQISPYSAWAICLWMRLSFPKIPPNVDTLYNAAAADKPDPFCWVLRSCISNTRILASLAVHRAGWTAHRKCVNIHGSLQRVRRSSLNDWPPSCPLALPAAMTRSPPAKWARECALARHQFVSVKPCLCIQWSYFQIFIPWKPALTSGEHILSGSWPFGPAEMNPAVYSCPPPPTPPHFLFYCMRYIVSFSFYCCLTFGC